MAILSAMQDAAVMLIGQRPDVFFGSRNNFETEIVSLANEVAEDIAQTHDWQKLVRVHVVNPVAGTTSHPLPPDYSRMLLDTEVQAKGSLLWGYSRYDDINQFLFDQNNGLMSSPGGWIIVGGEIQFYPAPTGMAQFPYISNRWARAADNSTKASFTADSDAYELPERLLKLALVWRWNEMKRLDATGDEAAFLKAFSEYAGKDSGSQVIRRGGRHGSHSLNTRAAYSGSWG